MKFLDQELFFVHFKPYLSPRLFNNGHIQSIFPVLFRKIKLEYERERIDTPDNDFLDLDWSRQNNNHLVIISHGLEGSSQRAYVKGMVKAVNQGGWDALAWNYRSCSGEPNRLLRSYHNGVTDDLSVVIEHAKKAGSYDQIALIGFSLGGNLTLLYLGKTEPDPIITRSVVFSVPCDLKGSSIQLQHWTNKIYMKRFLSLLHDKIKAKKKIFPGKIDDSGYSKIKDFKGFDDRYTAPIHGFKDAFDYWEKCSSKAHLASVSIPTLIVNALDDPFLPESCYPIKEAGQNPNLHLLTPDSGGHVGFIELNRENCYWSEKVAVGFLNK